MVRLHAIVGYKRIPSSARPSLAATTRSLRAAMQDVMQDIEDILDQINNATPDALEDALRPVFAESQRLVPVDTGALKESGFLGKTSDGSVIIGYGIGGDPFYAPYVHEQVQNYHKPPTQAKFLQQPLEESLDGLPGMISYHVWRRLRRK